MYMDRPGVGSGGPSTVGANANCHARDLYEATSFGVGGDSEAEF